MKLRIIIALLISVIIGYFVITAVDINEVIALSRQFPKSYFIILCVLSLLISLIKAMRFRLLIQSAGLKLGIWPTVKVYIAGQAAASLPGGESMRGLLLKKEINADIQKVAGPIACQAFIEFLAASIISILGSFYFGVLRLPAILLLLLLCGVIYTTLHETILHNLLAKFSRFRKIQTLQRNMPAIQQTIREIFIAKSSQFMPSRLLFTCISLAIVGQMLGGILIAIIANGFQVEISLLSAIFIYSSSIVVSALSGIVPGGFGLAEGGIAGILVVMKIIFEKAFAIVIVYRLVNSVFYMLIGIIFIMLFYFKSIILRK